MKTIKRNSPSIRTIEQLVSTLQKNNFLISAAWKNDGTTNFVLKPTPASINSINLKLAKQVADFIHKNGGRELVFALAKTCDGKALIVDGIIHVIVAFGNHVGEMRKLMGSNLITFDFLVEQHVQSINQVAVRSC
jgi:hypothetical protein